MRLLQRLAEFAFSTVFICLGAAFCVLLLVTMNVVVSLLATCTVLVVIVTVIALVVLSGFKNGMYEAIFTIIVVGMSIDYAVHLAHFFNEAVGTRYEKAREALHGVGVSVIGGAITTMGAGVPLLFCVVMFFNTQGNFVFFTALAAFGHSFLFLMPLFMICGPEGSQGDLTFLLRLCGAGKKRAPKAERTAAEPIRV